MIEFGEGFHEDLFSETKEKTPGPIPTSYNAKFCKPRWFETAAVPDDLLEQQHVWKYQADLAYREHQYATALHAYTQAKASLASSNTTVLREVEESICRCYLRLGSIDHATEAAQNVYTVSQNFEQKTGALNLLIDVYTHQTSRQTSHINTALVCYLVMQLSLHPINPDLWAKLGGAYCRLALIQSLQTQSKTTTLPNASDAPVVHAMTADSQDEEADDTVLCSSLCQLDLRNMEPLVCTGMAPALVVGTCFTRAWILYKEVSNTVASFAQTRNTEMQNKMKASIEALELGEDMDLCRKWLEGDLHRCPVDGEDNSSPDGDDSKGIPNVKILNQGKHLLKNAFEQKWFSWKQPTNSNNSKGNLF